MKISGHEDVRTAIQRINSVWLGGQVEDLAPMLDPNIVMVLPGFSGRIQGREEFLAGFRDFRENAQVHEFQEQDHETDVVHDTAVATFRYRMIYERLGTRYLATGRDLWVFRQRESRWIAVWRTMLDVREQPAA